MARLHSLGRIAGSLVAILAIGGLIGFIGSAILAPILPGPVLPGNRHEPDVSRQFILAFINGDADALNRLSVPKNIAQRALFLKAYADANGKVNADTLTYLGGATVGPLGAETYVVGLRAPDSSYHIASIGLTYLQNKVYYFRIGQEPGATASPSAEPSPGSAS